MDDLALRMLPCGKQSPQCLDTTSIVRATTVSAGFWRSRTCGIVKRDTGRVYENLAPLQHQGRMSCVLCHIESRALPKLGGDLRLPPCRSGESRNHKWDLLIATLVGHRRRWLWIPCTGQAGPRRTPCL